MLYTSLLLLTLIFLPVLAQAADYQTSVPCNQSVDAVPDPTVTYREPVDPGVPPATINGWSQESAPQLHFPIEIAPRDLQAGAGGADRLSNPGIAVGDVAIQGDQSAVSILGRPIGAPPASDCTQ